MTLCGVHTAAVTSSLPIDEGKFPRKHDLVLDAVKRAGGLSNVCPECLKARIMPWQDTHGQTVEDEFADDDDNWRALFAAQNEKTVD